MRALVVPLLVLVLGACAPSTSTGASSGASAVATSVPDATLTPLALSTEAPRHMKSAGEVFAVIDAQTIWVRVDQGNVNLQVSLNGALIALRTDAKTTYTKVTVGLSGPSDLHKGDHVTFAFDPGSRNTDGSYLATVIGR